MPTEIEICSNTRRKKSWNLIISEWNWEKHLKCYGIQDIQIMETSKLNWGGKKKSTDIWGKGAWEVGFGRSWKLGKQKMRKTRDCGNISNK